MSKIIVLGSGMVGSAMAIDLAKKHTVTLTDRSQQVLDKVKAKYPSLTTSVLDVTNIDFTKINNKRTRFGGLCCARFSRF
jgi:lysine 6-dehydrogenase